MEIPDVTVCICDTQFFIYVTCVHLYIYIQVIYNIELTSRKVKKHRSLLAANKLLNFQQVLAVGANLPHLDGLATIGNDLICQRDSITTSSILHSIEMQVCTMSTRKFPQGTQIESLQQLQGIPSRCRQLKKVIKTFTEVTADVMFKNDLKNASKPNRTTSCDLNSFSKAPSCASSIHGTSLLRPSLDKAKRPTRALKDGEPRPWRMSN